MHVAADLEHIGDHCTNIVEFAKSKIDLGIEFSDTARSEIDDYFERVSKMMKESIEALKEGNYSLAENVLKQEREMNRVEEMLREQHMQRLNEKKCSPELTVIYTDIIHDVEKIGDYCNNIAESVIKNINFREMTPKTEKADI
jgi:phosphate:Na+ symporter